MSLQRIGIVGAGSWGTALALVSARAGRHVRLWARDPAHVADMATHRENRRHLPGTTLPDTIQPTAERRDLADVDAVLLVVPAQTLRGVAESFADVVPEHCPVVICSKGIELATGAMMSEVLTDALPDRPVAVLSGPTFAKEVARDLPTAVTLACVADDCATSLSESLATRHFRPYATDDVVGAEVSGALKNVMAIACGIVGGRGLGENARASLITRALAEITRMALAKGGRAETLMGLGGIGDLTLTCSSEQSRNYAFGAAIGRGTPAAELLARPDVTVEGAHTAGAVPGLAKGLGVEMPISQAVAAVLHGGADLDAAMAGLLSRPLRAEGV